MTRGIQSGRPGERRRSCGAPRRSPGCQRASLRWRARAVASFLGAGLLSGASRAGRLEPWGSREGVRGGGGRARAQTREHGFPPPAPALTRCLETPWCHRGLCPVPLQHPERQRGRRRLGRSASASCAVAVLSPFLRMLVAMPLLKSQAKCHLSFVEGRIS